MDSATWCRTPAADSAARRLWPEVSKNSSTALSSNEGELARSITTCAPATASLTPSPVMVLTPLLGDAATTSWPPRRRMATVFEPIRPVPPITTIFMTSPPGCCTFDTSPLARRLRAHLGRQGVPDTNELADGPQLHLGDDIGAVEFDRDLADAEVESDLLVQLAGRDSSQPLTFAQRQQREPAAILIDDPRVRAL